MRHLECATAQTHDVLVHKSVAAEVGDHPAVVQSTVECGNEVLGEGHQEHDPHTSPLIEVICGVLDTTPLTANGCHCALAVQTAEASFTVEDNILLVCCIKCHECSILFFYTIGKSDCVVLLTLKEFVPISLFEHFCEDFHAGHEVLALLLPIDIIFSLKELGIGILRFLSHYLLPSSL